ncbi:MAG: nitrous oxide reductase accessory protein NosL [Thermodesulfovibrionales bacterium]
MKTMAIILSVLVGFVFLAGQAVAEPKEDVHLYKSCKYCGMDRGSFDFSRMLINYDDGTSVAVCSIHCAAVDLANTIDKAPKSISVGDFNTKELIDAEKAFWIIGGSKPGVMSKTGKWAFAKKEDAENFMTSNGGKLADFEAAMKAAYEDMYSDTKMIRDKRKAMKMQHKMKEHKH